MEQIVVVGASLAGVRAVEAVRRAGFTDRVVLVGEESVFPPVDRPPLSKGFLHEGGTPTQLRVAPDLEVASHLGTRADALDVANRRVVLADGREIAYGGLIVATGATARHLPDLDGRANVHVLRTLSDAERLKAQLVPGRRIVVIGAGVLGCEIAATSSELGLQVAVVEPLEQPMLRMLGPTVAPRIADLHRRHGVDLWLGRSYAGAEGGDRVDRVLLDDGTALPADVVVVAIGATPETRWLTGSGLDVADGVLCDSACFAVGGEGRVVAAGDVARWTHPLLGAETRVEHWTNAVAQGQLAGRNLVRALAGEHDRFEEHASLPYSWSDQYENKIQFVGILGEDVTVVEDRPERLVTSFRTGGRVVGALLLNAPDQLHRWRTEITQQAQAQPV